MEQTSNTHNNIEKTKHKIPSLKTDNTCGSKILKGLQIKKDPQFAIAEQSSNSPIPNLSVICLLTSLYLVREDNILKTDYSGLSSDLTSLCHNHLKHGQCLASRCGTQIKDVIIGTNVQCQHREDRGSIQQIIIYGNKPTKQQTKPHFNQLIV